MIKKEINVLITGVGAPGGVSILKALTHSNLDIRIVTADMNDKSGLGIPRSFELPYNKEVHEKISKATVSLKNGIPQMGEIVEDDKEAGVISKVLEKKKTIEI